MQEILTLEFEGTLRETPPKKTFLTPIGGISVEGFGKNLVWVDVTLPDGDTKLCVFGAVNVEGELGWKDDNPTLMRLDARTTPCLKLPPPEILQALSPYLDELRDLSAERVAQDKLRTLHQAIERVSLLEVHLANAKDLLAKLAYEHTPPHLLTTKEA